jgi:hypothetical protein
MNDRQLFAKAGTMQALNPPPFPLISVEDIVVADLEQRKSLQIDFAEMRLAHGSERFFENRSRQPVVGLIRVTLLPNVSAAATRSRYEWKPI